MTFTTKHSLRGAVAALGTVAFATAATAQDFSANSEANGWGLASEQKARFEATVVDILCELAGDCVDDCGNGDRQLGLLRSADDVLVLAAKNTQPIFTGAAQDLAPYCNQLVEVDGLLIGPADLTAMPVYQVQVIRPVGESEWSKANRWTEAWTAANPEAAGLDGPWFRNDPRVNALIARDGFLGLGEAVDAAFIEEWF